MRELLSEIVSRRFTRYITAGAFATLVDWGSFFILALLAGVYYQGALVVSFSLGCVANFTLNKIFTFHCRSKRIFRQFSIHIAVSLVSLLFSMALMFIFVDLLLLQAMVSRMATTFIMLIANYFMHKHLTFNQRFLQWKQ